MAELEGIHFNITGDNKGALSNVQKTIEALRELGRIAESNASKMSAFKDTIKKLGSVATTPIKNLTNRFKEMGTRVTQLFNAFKRIAMYRLLRTAIKTITEGFKEGMQNAYFYSQVLEGTFAKSMDRLATSSLYLKNSLGAMSMPIMNMLVPAIDFVIDKFVALINVVNQVLSLMSGASTWTQALRYPKQYAEATGGATAKVKELKKTILGFDEINKLVKQSDPNSGGGAAALDYSKMFKQSPFDTDLKKFFDEKDWKGLGTYFGNKINDMINSIDWAGLGKKFGEKLDMYWQTLYYTLKTVDFANLGKQVATFLNNTIESVDWQIVGRLAVRKITAMFDFVIGFLRGMNWGAVGKMLSDYIMGRLFEWSEWLLSVDWIGFGMDLYNGFVDFIKNVDWLGLVKTALTLVDVALSSLLGFAIGFFIGFIDDLANNILPFIFEKASGIGDWSIQGFFEGILGAIGLVGGLVKWVKDTIVNPFIKGFKETLGINSPSTVLRDIGRDTLQGFYIGVKAKFEEMYTWLKQKVEAIKKVFNFTWKFPEIKLPHIPTPHFEWKTLGVGRYSLSYPSFSGWYAQGGFPTTGDLFMANEKGAEMVGSMNGRTTVANNQQIVDGIRQGVRDANQDEVRLLREQNDLLRELIVKSGVVNIPLHAITDSLERKNQRDGGTFVPVG